MTIDLATAGGRAQARSLALASDVLVENFRPGTMERMGLGSTTCARSIRGWCSARSRGSGPARKRPPGYDLVPQAVGGLMSITGPAPGAPTKVGVAVVDVIAGLHASMGILPRCATATAPERDSASTSRCCRACCRR